MLPASEPHICPGKFKRQSNTINLFIANGWVGKPQQNSVGITEMGGNSKIRHEMQENQRSHISLLGYKCKSCHTHQDFSFIPMQKKPGSFSHFTFGAGFLFHCMKHLKSTFLKGGNPLSSKAWSKSKSQSLQTISLSLCGDSR